MPLIKMQSSSLIESIELRGTPTASEWSAISTAALAQKEIGSLVNTSPSLLEVLDEIISLGGDSLSS